MWKLIEPGAWSSVPVQSAWQTSPSRQIVSTILNGPLPRPSSSTQSVKVTGSSGMYRRMMCAIAARVRSSSASQAPSNVSGPKRSQISTTRRSAARQPPMIAIRSLRFVSGVRVLLRITSSAVSLRTPRSKILIGGIRIPSSQIESASETWLPGTFPPTSIMWPKSEANATRLPSKKIGRITSQSLQWEIDPLQRYGSFSRITSPSTISPPKRSITSGM